MECYPQYDCATCSDGDKEWLGCGKQGGSPPLEIDGEWYIGCPRHPILSHPQYYSRLFRFYNLQQKGLFPVGGGEVDQPHKLMMLLAYMESVISLCEEMKAPPKKGK